MNAAASEEDATRGTTHCRVCAHVIPVGAKKCVKCGEFQSPFWRIAAGLDLKGLLALLPLLALIYAFLAERVEPQQSALQLFPIGCTSDTVDVFGSNVGNRAAAVTAARYSVGIREDGTLQHPGEPATRVFAANSSHVMRWVVDLSKEPGGLAPYGADTNGNCWVELRFTVLDYDGTNREALAGCACPT